MLASAAAFQNQPPMWDSTASLKMRSRPTRASSTFCGTLPLRKPGIFVLAARSDEACSTACFMWSLGTSTSRRTRFSGSSSTVVFTAAILPAVARLTAAAPAASPVRDGFPERGIRRGSAARPMRGAHAASRPRSRCAFRRTARVRAARGRSSSFHRVDRAAERVDDQPVGADDVLAGTSPGTLPETTTVTWQLSTTPTFASSPPARAAACSSVDPNCFSTHQFALPAPGPNGTIWYWRVSLTTSTGPGHERDVDVHREGHRHRPGRRRGRAGQLSVGSQLRPARLEPRRQSATRASPTGSSRASWSIPARPERGKRAFLRFRAADDR